MTNEAAAAITYRPGMKTWKCLFTLLCRRNRRLGVAWAAVDDDAVLLRQQSSCALCEAAAVWLTVREDALGGDPGVKDQQAVTAQLFKGNDLLVLLGYDTKGAVVTVHIYDLNGNKWNWKQCPAISDVFAGAKVIPKDRHLLRDRHRGEVAHESLQRGRFGYGYK